MSEVDRPVNNDLEGKYFLMHRGAIALNNLGVSLMEQMLYQDALAAFHDGLSLLHPLFATKDICCSCVPVQGERLVLADYIHAKIQSARSRLAYGTERISKFTRNAGLISSPQTPYLKQCPFPSLPNSDNFQYLPRVIQPPSLTLTDLPDAANQELCLPWPFCEGGMTMAPPSIRMDMEDLTEPQSAMGVRASAYVTCSVLLHNTSSAYLCASEDDVIRNDITETTVARSLAATEASHSASLMISKLLTDLSNSVMSNSSPLSPAMLASAASARPNVLSECRVSDALFQLLVEGNVGILASLLTLEQVVLNTLVFMYRRLGRSDQAECCLARQTYLLDCLQPLWQHLLISISHESDCAAAA